MLFLVSVVCAATILAKQCMGIKVWFFFLVLVWSPLLVLGDERRRERKRDVWCSGQPQKLELAAGQWAGHGEGFGGWMVYVVGAVVIMSWLQLQTVATDQTKLTGRDDTTASLRRTRLFILLD
jgi:hypothetical protein